MLKRVLIGLLFALLPAVVSAQATVSSSGGGAAAFSGGDIAGQANFCGPDNATNVEIGSCTNDANGGTGGTSVVIGNAANNLGNGTGLVIIGSSAGQASGQPSTDAIMIGRSASAGSGAGPSNSAVVIGALATAHGASGSLAIGSSASCSGVAPSAAIGPSAACTANNQLVMGANGSGFLDVYFGEGVANTSALGYTIHGTGGSGTDNAGGAVTIAPGIGTGTAVGGQVVLQRTQRNATGTAAQPLLMAHVSCPVKILSNTSATVQAVATITTTSVSGGSITADYSTTACSGTVCNTDGGLQKIAWRNAAGTVTAAVSSVTGQVDADASGTLATTPTATVATNVVTYNFTPTWATIVPTSVLGYVTFLVNSLDSVVCQ